jgi:hypothetical protein
MTNELIYDFDVIYDEETVRTSANKLLAYYWTSQLPKTITVTVLSMALMGMFVWYSRSPSLWWITYATPAALALSWLYLYWSVPRRMLRRLNEKVHYRFTTLDFSVSSSEGTIVLPWHRFKRTVRDERSLLLCLSNRLAFVVPTKYATEEALEFVMSKIRAHTHVA